MKGEINTSILFGVIIFVIFLIALIIAYLTLMKPYTGENLENVVGILEGDMFG